MPQPSGEGGDFAIARTSVEVVVRVGMLLLLVFWCFSIAQPFLVPIVWGMVIAVAVYRGFAKLRRLLGERDGLAAALVSLILLLVLIAPLAMLSRALVDDVAGLAGALDRGQLTIPPPPGWLAGWPVIGAPLDQFWRQAIANLGAAMAQIEPQLRAAGDPPRLVTKLPVVRGKRFGIDGHPFVPIDRQSL